MRFQFFSCIFSDYVDNRKAGDKVFKLDLHDRFFRSLSYRLVEHAAVNRRVVGSSPTWGARQKPWKHMFPGLFLSVWNALYNVYFTVCCFLDVWVKTR